MASTFLYEDPFVEIRSIEPAFGPTAGGIAVAILGRGFRAGITVDIGGSAASSVVVESDERITAVAPAHAGGAVDVVVTNTDASTDTLVGGFTYQNVARDYDIAYRTPDGDPASRIRYDNAVPTIRKQMGQPDSMSFTAAVEPNGLDFVQFYAFGQQLFIGTAVRIMERAEGFDPDTGDLLVCWDVEALGLEHEIGGEHPVETYTNVSGSTVLQLLLITYAPGYSYSGVEGGLPDVTIILDGSKDLWTAIMEVCDQCGAKCFMAGTTLYAFTDDPGYDPPAAVTPTNPDLVWPDQGNPITIEYDYSQIVNDVTARGAEGVEARYQDQNSIWTYRKRRGWINNNDLTTLGELGQAARQVVEAGKDPIPIVRYSTHDLKTDRGKKVTIAMDQPAIDGEWIIDSVDISLLELLSGADAITDPTAKLAHRPLFKVTAKPAYVGMRQRRLSTVDGVLQTTIDLGASAKKAPKLDGDVVSDSGGRTVIPPRSVTHEQLAGCIGAEELESTGVEPGTYGGPSSGGLPVFTVDETGRIISASTVPAGPEFKTPARVASTANIAALSGLLTIDGVTLVAGDRVLVKDQDDPTENGIYVAASGAWSRSSDADTSAEVAAGLTINVTEGTAGADSWFTLATNNPIVLGTTPLTFVEFGGGGGSGSGDIKSDGTVPFAADESMGGFRIKDSADPVDDQDLVTKAYSEAHYYEPLTNGDPTTPELVFDSDGDVVMVLI